MCAWSPLYERKSRVCIPVGVVCQTTRWRPKRRPFGHTINILPCVQLARSNTGITHREVTLQPGLALREGGYPCFQCGKGACHGEPTRASGSVPHSNFDLKHQNGLLAQRNKQPRFPAQTRENETLMHEVKTAKNEQGTSHSAERFSERWYNKDKKSHPPIR